MIYLRVRSSYARRSKVYLAIRVVNPASLCVHFARNLAWHCAAPRLLFFYSTFKPHAHAYFAGLWSDNCLCDSPNFLVMVHQTLNVACNGPFCFTLLLNSDQSPALRRARADCSVRKHLIKPARLSNLLSACSLLSHRRCCAARDGPSGLIQPVVRSFASLT